MKEEILKTPADYPHTFWTETHKYVYSGGETSEQGMATGYSIIPPYTLCKECSNNLWPIPVNLTGIATVKGLFYDGYPATSYINRNIDRSIP